MSEEETPEVEKDVDVETNDEAADPAEPSDETPIDASDDAEA